MSSQRFSEMKALDAALGECLKEKEELRELNAELLAAFKRFVADVEPSRSVAEYHCGALLDAYEAIAKAEGRE